MKALILAALMVANFAHAKSRLPTCSLSSLARPALFPTRCRLEETGEVVDLEEGEQVLGFVFNMNQLPNINAFLKEAKEEIQKKFDGLKDKEGWQLEPIHLKLSYNPDLKDDRYVGSVTSKVVAKGKKAEKAGITFTYNKQFDHKPTEVERKDVGIEAAKQFTELIKWSGVNEKKFAPPSKPEADGLDTTWEVTVTIQLKARE